jgi:hypothetical protein
VYTFEAFSGLCDLLLQQPPFLQTLRWSLRDEDHESADFAPFPALGVQDDTLAGLTEHPDRGFTAMIAKEKIW